MTVNHDVAGSSPAGGANEKPEAIASGFFVGSLVDLQSTISRSTVVRFFASELTRSR